MILKIFEAIGLLLKKEFGEGYELYREEIKQDLQSPCFLITCLNPRQKPFRKNRYFRECQFCIQYFPFEEGNREECDQTAERLFFCLEYLPVETVFLCGTQMNYQVTDGVLHFFVNYNGFFEQKADLLMMEEISVKVSTER